MSGTATDVNTGANTTTQEKPKLKICCACPETKRARDECIVLRGEDQCGPQIEAHKVCLRAAGFTIQ
ncbi:hypothetical protein PROFUN_01131 [Planoprotostelium fungivorum]|uniref:Cytochrome c oxidase copper chaperone n=1 Tax=Planoprotostelium fungivorum TaxID=1890364 RepID=A0A2P6NCD3_9EUKA|nr:hypothetical protein PROFUN_01131 [Planoprotostelium fungivorum]